MYRQRYKSVSYTHLDVYKRQGRYHSQELSKRFNLKNCPFRENPVYFINQSQADSGQLQILHVARRVVGDSRGRGLADPAHIVELYRNSSLDCQRQIAFQLPQGKNLRLQGPSPGPLEELTDMLLVLVLILARTI